MKKSIQKIIEMLRSRYPVVKTQLSHKTPYQLLIATILSAQCTDAQVNRVTPVLFKAFPGPSSLAEASLNELETIIFSTGFYKNKAKNIKACARSLMGDYRGQVPDTLEALTRLPGVGRKTANVVLAVIFNVSTIVVDTHVLRISRRLGLTRKKDPVSVEFDLMKKIPESDWNDFSLRMIYFGREVCQAKKPGCGRCPVYDLCPTGRTFK